MKWRITLPIYSPPRSSQAESIRKRESPDSWFIPSHHFVTSLIRHQARSSLTRWTLWRSAWVLRTARMTFGESWYAPTLRCRSSLKRTRLNRWWSHCLCCNVTCLILGCPNPVLEGCNPVGGFVLPVRRWEPSWSAELGLVTPVVDEERRERASVTGWFCFLPLPQKSPLSHLLLGEHDIPLTCLEQVVTGICGENITYVNYSIDIWSTSYLESQRVLACWDGCSVRALSHERHTCCQTAGLDKLPLSGENILRYHN